MLDPLNDCWFLQDGFRCVELLKGTCCVFLNVAPDASLAVRLRFDFYASKFFKQVN
jgi:hypothetical protein